VKVADYHSRYAPVYGYRFAMAPRLVRWIGLDATHGLELYPLFGHLEVGSRAGRLITVLGDRDSFTGAGGTDAGPLAELRHERKAGGGLAAL
jgi:para-nitrobenzyl esterase